MHTALFRIFRLGLLSVVLGGAGPARAEIVLSEYGASRPLKIMAIGDSITDDCVYNGAWRLYLQPLLEANGYPFTFVGRQVSGTSGKFTKTWHEGYCGSVIAPPGMMSSSVHGYAGTNVYLLKTIADTLTNATLRPDLVLVVMGANDIGRARDPYRVATNDMPRLLELLFSNAPNAHILLTKTTTLSNAVAGYMTNAPNVPVYNSALQEMVKGRQALGQKVFLADMFSALDYSTMFDSDHLHPNWRGLNAMAKEFFDRIQAITVRSNGVTTTLIPGGAEWKYSASGQDLGTAWSRNDYDDTAWSRGVARVGYGDPAAVTSLGFGPNPTDKPLTFYFRRSFVVPKEIA
ncbi:MAG TPA: GDSL-type esterase/lipase family protein, partial [Candidatus Sulfotelmatobacter sp.]|nr:GDSL-type esterase/lipase family protein [Candidatus Sulfotelmatobacter sp.]